MRWRARPTAVRPGAAGDHPASSPTVSLGLPCHRSSPHGVDVSACARRPAHSFRREAEVPPMLFPLSPIQRCLTAPAFLEVKLKQIPFAQALAGFFQARIALNFAMSIPIWSSPGGRSENS
jgi:hypothetical protein